MLFPKSLVVLMCLFELLHERVQINPECLVYVTEMNRVEPPYCVIYLSRLRVLTECVISAQRVTETDNRYVGIDSIQSRIKLAKL